MRPRSRSSPRAARSRRRGARRVLELQACRSSWSIWRMAAVAVWIVSARVASLLVWFCTVETTRAVGTRIIVDVIADQRLDQREAALGCQAPAEAPAAPRTLGSTAAIDAGRPGLAGAPVPRVSPCAPREACAAATTQRLNGVPLTPSTCSPAQRGAGLRRVQRPLLPASFASALTHWPNGVPRCPATRTLLSFAQSTRTRCRCSGARRAGRVPPGRAVRVVAVARQCERGVRHRGGGRQGRRSNSVRFMATSPWRRGCPDGRHAVVIRSTLPDPRS